MIRFFSEDIDFVVSNKAILKKWINNIISIHNAIPGDINIIFCSDSYLLSINNKYLNHNYYTDIITFDYCEGKRIIGDLFISIDTVKINSEQYSSDFENELHRVIIHGVLHLLGYDDHTEEETLEMHSLEDSSLNILNNVR
jgi:metalloprotein, YbeY/UPF0054 family